MPFLIGLQASLLPSLKQLPMDEVSLIDLDLGTCQPPPGSPTDDARLLPWADRLQAALQVTTSLQYICLSTDAQSSCQATSYHLKKEHLWLLIPQMNERTHVMVLRSIGS
jgi:hypothetical protein